MRRDWDAASAGHSVVARESGKLRPSVVGPPSKASSNLHPWQRATCLTSLQRSQHNSPDTLAVKATKGATSGTEVFALCLVIRCLRCTGGARQ